MDLVILTRKFNLAARTLFLYEYLLTLDLEVEYFWRSRLTRATALYFANRYCNVFLSITNVIELVFRTESDLACEILEMTLAAEVVTAQLLLLAFSILRVHAVTDRNWWYTMGVLVVAMVSPAILTYISANSYGQAVPPPVHACAMAFKLSFPEYDRLIIVARLGIIFCDLFVILFIMRVVGIPWMRPRIQSREAPVTVSLLRNSIVLLLLNTAQITVSALHIKVQIPRLTFHFFTRMTSIFITRMLTSLREADRSLDDDFLSLFVHADIQNVETFALREFSTLRFGSTTRSTVTNSSTVMTSL
ncbi:hypothetical protein L226DRAFT_540397 [Lentinus tigrinus ALCF2SS1-7]|uniref:DUF6533 domain-containing protein n=1 Tax=Lentinus tigrinus ALCF2SS1-6 TaxID=1328759 RepID=A0A5C2S6L0_9APHY|nr:hypothetical protein L227DRAFT_576190 [Lentinus tigrinus ALCF2SS1-6]RPD68754.1 hypothetical protein L226DRAFT_540397 [Lentinus tigrinus ALCF2SS1-7]